MFKVFVIFRAAQKPRLLLLVDGSKEAITFPWKPQTSKKFKYIHT